MSETARCTLDTLTRKIIVPKQYRLMGVESDEKANRILFEFPKIVGDGIDLSELNLYINYQNGNGEKDIYVVSDRAVVDDKITFSWQLSRKVTAYEGVVSYLVCAKYSVDGETLTEWNSKIAVGLVSEGLEAKQEVEDQEYDIIDQLLSRLVADEETFMKIDDLQEAAEMVLAEAKNSGEFNGEDGFSPIIETFNTDTGYRVSITDINGPHEVVLKNGKSAYSYAFESGYDKTESQFGNDLKSISNKVDKVSGKNLSTNDYTNESKMKVDAIPENPKYTDTVYDDTNISNKIETVETQINAIKSNISNKVDKVSGKDLSTNDYTDESKMKVDAIPENPKYTDTVYDDTEIKDKVEKLDSAVSGKVDKVVGKDLSTNDFTNAYKSKLDNLSIPTKLTDLENNAGFITNTVDNLSEYYNKGQVDNLLNGKQATIEDLVAIRSGAALGATSIQFHQDISGKVDRVEGKGLSTNDYTNEEKEKLDSISIMTGASSQADGVSGLVPRPTKLDSIRYLRGDGTWTVPTDTNNPLLAIDSIEIFEDYIISGEIYDFHMVWIGEDSTEYSYIDIVGVSKTITFYNGSMYNVEAVILETGGSFHANIDYITQTLPEPAADDSGKTIRIVNGKWIKQSVDTNPTTGSSNLVTSGAVASSLSTIMGFVNGKQDSLSTRQMKTVNSGLTSVDKTKLDTVDTTPIADSTNLISSGAVYTAINTAIGNIETALEALL